MTPLWEYKDVAKAGLQETHKMGQDALHCYLGLTGAPGGIQGLCDRQAHLSAAPGLARTALGGLSTVPLSHCAVMALSFRGCPGMHIMI